MAHERLQRFGSKLNKVKEVIKRGKNIKDILSLADYEYREFTRHIRRKTSKGINDMKREVKHETSGIG